MKYVFFKYLAKPFYTMIFYMNKDVRLLLTSSVNMDSIEIWILYRHSLTPEV